MDVSDAIFAKTHRCRHIRRAAIVDDDQSGQERLAGFLRDMEIATEVWPKGIDPSSLDRFDPDLILLGVKLRVSDAFTILRSQIPRSYRGVVSIVSGERVDVVMDAMLLGEKLGFRIGAPALKPFSREDIFDVVSAADDLLERRLTGKSALSAHTESPAGQGLRLRQALDEGLLEVWYQPKFEAETGLVAGAEALVRARAADGEIITPHVLLRDAAKEDMLALTDFVLTSAVEHSVALASLGFDGKLSINIPLSYLLQVDPCRILRAARGRQSWPGFIFEINDDDSIDDISQLQIIATQLKLYNVSLSIDEFGASPLARLIDIPFTEIKIDRSFVHNCSTDSMRRSICASVLGLGAELGLTTVAEGVDDEADMQVLAELGCDLVQGFLFAKPMPFKELLEFIELQFIVQPSLASVRSAHLCLVGRAK